MWKNIVELRGVISSQTTSPNCAKTCLAPVVEEATEPSLDVSLAAENPDDEKVQNAPPLQRASLLLFTLILSNHFLFQTGIG
jgi:hypothetical protein